VGKQHKLCYYDLCPSPMQSNKWRTVTQGTAAGGQVWDGLVGKMLCDSCYSTFRKHGTLVRSVRTPDGWARLDGDGTIYRPNQAKNVRKRAAPAGGGDASKRKKPSAVVAAVHEPKQQLLQQQQAQKPSGGDAHAGAEWGEEHASRALAASSSRMEDGASPMMGFRDPSTTDVRSGYPYSDDGALHHNHHQHHHQQQHHQQQQQQQQQASGHVQAPMDSIGSGVPMWYHASSAYLADNIAAC
jgi:hypothetical protein